LRQAGLLQTHQAGDLAPARLLVGPPRTATAEQIRDGSGLADAPGETDFLRTPDALLRPGGVQWQSSVCPVPAPAGQRQQQRRDPTELGAAHFSRPGD
jgi:hypothetical protein